MIDLKVWVALRCERSKEYEKGWRYLFTGIFDSELGARNACTGFNDCYSSKGLSINDWERMDPEQEIGPENPDDWIWPNR